MVDNMHILFINYLFEYMVIGQLAEGKVQNEYQYRVVHIDP